MLVLVYIIKADIIHLYLEIDKKPGCQKYKKQILY